MAKQQKRGRTRGKAQASKPITSHQLFPAVVALWFGALFGLGSLAVRPSLIESLVMKIRLDLVVPAAAPPLGITARMLIALVLATLGAMIGVVIARRFNRPKAEVRQRKRSARNSEADDRPMFGQPLSIQDDLDEAEQSGSLFSGRRRAGLTVEPEHVDFVPHEYAPLPGGVPQVLDITGVELAEYSPIESTPAEPAPLDLGAFARHETAAAHPIGAAPRFAPPAAMAEVSRQVFQPAPPIEAPAAFAPAPLTPATALPQDSVPDAGSRPEAAPRQIFGMPVEDDHVDQDFIRAAGFKTSVFEQDAHHPLFPERAAAYPAEAAASAPEPDFGVPVNPPFAAPAAPEPIAALAQPEPAPLPPVSSLGMTDLATRLQQSMLRRRAARTRVAPAPEPALPMPLEATPVAGLAPAPMAQAEPVASEPAAFKLSPAITRFEPSAAPQVPVPGPSLLSPAPAYAAPDPAAVVPPAPMPMPTALRPLSFDDSEDETDDLLASLLPPRHVTMPSPAPAFTPPAAFAVPEPAAEPAPVTAEVGEEESYASLLDIGQPLSARSQFVRIDEPESEAAAIEPVVIFPGQTPLAAVPSDSDTAPFRRFDAPSAAGQGGPLANHAPMPATDPAEAERVLRAALANLQRMSGAA